MFVTAVDPAGGGWLHGFSTLTGEPLWPAVHVWALGAGLSLTADSGVLLVGSEGWGPVTAVAADTGHVMWTWRGGGSSEPQAAAGKAYVGRDVLNLFTGEQEYSLPDIPTLTTIYSPTGNTSPYDFDVVDGSTWYIAGACNDVVRIDGTTPVWRSIRTCDGATQGPHVFELGTVLTVNNDGYVDLDPTDGRVVDATGSSWAPASAGDTLFVTDGTYVRADTDTRTRSTGLTRWPTTLRRSPSSPGTPCLS